MTHPLPAIRDINDLQERLGRPLTSWTVALDPRHAEQATTPNLEPRPAPRRIADERQYVPVP